MKRRTHAHFPSPLTTGHYPLATHSGFTFVEVLFAIIILGIGSIMLAGMLPVAIKQSSDTRNEITGKSVCEAGFAYLQSLSQTNPAAFPVTDDTTKISAASIGSPPASPGQFIPLNHSVIVANGTASTDPLYPQASLFGSRILTSDPRFQWLAYYSRQPAAGSARVVILALRLQNIDATIPGSPAPIPIDRYRSQTLLNETVNADNGPFQLTAEVRDGGALDPDTIKFTDPSTTAGLGALNSGAFVVVASQPAAANDPQRPYRNNGRVFRLAAERTDLEASEGGGVIYDLQPGYDLSHAGPGPDGKMNTADDLIDGSMNPTNTAVSPAVNNQYAAGTTVSTGTNARVWVVGRGLKNPAVAYDAATNPYSGLVQDISVLSAQIPLSQ